MYPVIMLLRARGEFWRKISANSGVADIVFSMLVFIIVSSAAYGSVLAGWRSPVLAGYVAVKFPVLLIGTTSLVMVLNWMFATVAGSGLSFRQVMAITYGAMGVACWILLSLIPVTLFFTFGVASDRGSHEELRFTHNCLLLTHVTLIALAGVAGNSALRQGLREVIVPTCSPRKIYWGWIVSFALVGCQLSWMLRPFVGSPFFDVAFIRPDALDRNFFEFLFIEVLPYVFKGG